jgi:hypothetical protein
MLIENVELGFQLLWTSKLEQVRGQLHSPAALSLTDYYKHLDLQTQFFLIFG